MASVIANDHAKAGIVVQLRTVLTQAKSCLATANNTAQVDLRVNVVYFRYDFFYKFNISYFLSFRFIPYYGTGYFSGILSLHRISKSGMGCSTTVGSIKGMCIIFDFTNKTFLLILKRNTYLWQFHVNPFHCFRAAMHYCRSRLQIAAPDIRTIRVSRSSTTIRRSDKDPHLACLASRLMTRLTHRTSRSSSHSFRLWTMLLFALHKSPKEYQHLQYPTFQHCAVLCKRIDIGHIISKCWALRNKMTDLRMAMSAQNKRRVREKDMHRYWNYNNGCRILE